jgi:hypothetical protein
VRTRAAAECIRGDGQPAATLVSLCLIDDGKQERASGTSENAQKRTYVAQRRHVSENAPSRTRERKAVVATGRGAGVVVKIVLSGRASRVRRLV